MAFIQRLPKSTLYILRGATLGAGGALAYLYFSNRARENAKVAPSYPVVSELKDDMPLADLPMPNRVDFVKKVYGIVGLQIGATILSTLFAFRRPALFASILKPALIVGAVGGIGSIIAMQLPVVRKSNFRKKVCLGVFTASEMATVPLACLSFPREVVLSALASTGVMTGALTAYAHTSRKDFTIHGGLICALLFGFVGYSTLMLFFPRMAAQQFMAWVGAALFSFTLLHDTQKMLGKGKVSYRYCDYDLAAVSVYLDILNLFMQMLRIMGNSGSKK